MLQAIIDFFKRLFGGGTSEPTTPPPKTSTNTSGTTSTPPKEEVVDVPDTTDLPKVDVTEPQDGSEITADTTVVMVNETPPEELELPPVIVDPVAVEEPSTSPPVTEEPTELEPAHKQRYLWCLDNGHGKKTAGKRSPVLEDGRQLLEYEFNRDIVKRIIDKLKVIGVAHYNVVPEVDIDNFLEGRVARANQKESDLPKLFVSIHSNAAPAPPNKWADPKISGVETWFYHGNNRGKKLAAAFQKHIIKNTGWQNRNIKSRPSKQFYVLKNTRMTAILTENGFLNNKVQCKELLKDSVRQKIADAHVAAILDIERDGIS